MHKPVAHRILTASIAAFLTITATHAATVTWDTNPGTTGAQDGAGTWDTSTPDWWNGTSDVAFTSGSNVIFGAAAGNAAYTVTLASLVTVGTMSFDPTDTFPRYTVDLGGNTLTANGTISLHGQLNDYYAAFTDGTLTLADTSSTASAPDILYVPNAANDFGVSIAATVNVGTGNRFIGGTTSRDDVARYAGDLRFDGSIIGSATLNFVGGAQNSGHNMHFVLNGDDSNFTGAINIQAGDLELTNNAALTSANAVTFSEASGARSALFLWGHNITIGSLNDTGVGTSRISNGSTNSTNGGSDSSGTSAGAIPLGVNSDAVLTVTQTTTGTFKGVIGDGPNDNGASGNGSNYRKLGLTKAGNATLILSGANTYSGPTTITAGQLTVSGSLAAGSAVTVNGGILNATGTINGAVTVNGGGLLMGTGTINALTTLASGGNLVGGVNGTGTLALSGGLTIGSAPTDTATISITPSATAAINVGGTFTLNGNPNTTAINIAGAAPALGQYPLISYAGSLAGTGFSAFTLGTLPSRVVATLVNDTGNHSVDLNVTGVDFPVWTGKLSDEWSTNTLSAPKNWVLNSNNAITTDYLEGDTVLFNDSAVNTTVDVSVATVSPSAVTFANSTQNYTLTGASGIIGSASLTKSGTGTLTITNINGFTGAVNFNGGVISVSSIANGGTISPLGAGTAFIFNGGTLAYTGSSASTDRSITLNSGGGIINTNSATNLTFSGQISGTGSLTQTGAGTITLTAANSFTGGVAINGGTVAASSVAAAGTNSALGSGGTLTFNGGTLNFTGSSGTTDYPVTFAGNGTIQTTGALTLSGVISGTGALTKTGSSSLTLSGTSNTYSGGTNLAAGPSYSSGTNALAITNGNALGTGPLNITSTSGLYIGVTNNAAVTLNNNIALPAPTSAQTYGLNKSSSGQTTGTQLTLAGVISGGNANTTLFLNTTTAGDSTTNFYFANDNTFVGKVQLNRGTITVVANDSLGAATNQLVMDGNSNSTLGDLQFANSMTFTHPISTITSGYTNPIGTNGNNVTLTGNISGSGGLTKVGNGTLTLTGTQSYTGATSVKGGTLEVDSALSTSSGVTVNTGGTLNVVGTVSGHPTTVSGGTVTVSPTGTLSNSTLTVNSGNVVISGNLSGSTTTVNGGTFEVDAGSTVTNSPITVGGTGTLTGGGIVGATTLNSGGTFAPGLNGPGFMSVGGNLSLNSGSQLALDLNGTTGISQYDQVLVANTGTTVTLGGDLQLLLGYTPAVNDVFYIIINQSGSAINGTFSNAIDQGNGTGLLTIGNDTFLVSYSASFATGGQAGFTPNQGQDVALELISVPEPNTAAALVAGLSSLLGLQRFRRRIAR